MERSRIQLLPEALANQIAAGEVVQRPASVVKELLENSLDAGATQIRLVIQDAGKKLIQVVDNGMGMSPTDARMSFERHATSKIRSIEDLFQVRTMGFRGEALASIAAVAQVELKTRMADDELGTRLDIQGGELKAQEPTQTPVGTVLSVRNLFYNVPARRNFLKSNPVEFRHILNEFYHAALSEPQVQMVLENNGQVELDLARADSLQRMLDLHSPLKKEDLLPISFDSALLRVSGYIGTPQVARKSRGQQYFLVNGRYIRSPYLHHALVTGYADTLPAEQHPTYVVYIEIDPSQVDINIHPTKTEIKFQEEREVYAALLAAVRMALGSLHSMPHPELQGTREGMVNTEIYGQRPGRSSSAPDPTLGQLLHTRQQPAPRAFDWEQLYPPELRQPARHPVLPITDVDAIPGLFAPTESLPTTFRISPRLLLYRHADGLYYIDLE
ncbi:MAG: DNA mismatch repair endonuclease MutL, partial [Sphingobacteriia bacterium]